MTINPVVAWREAKGLSRGETAILTGLSYSQISAAESGLGSSLPLPFLETIAALDGPEQAHAIEQAYHDWRTAQAQAITQRLAKS